MKRVLLTGATGFFGKHVKEALSHYDLFPVGSKNYNLLDINHAKSMFDYINPNVVVHLASKVGGILANKTYPAEFWYKNMMMTTQIWELSKQYKVDKLVYVMPACTYPKSVPSPITEESLWDGYPDEFSAPGALTKKMGLVASYAYKKQHGLNSCVLIPANLYGEHDHFFDEQNSHVVPALIAKMHKAKLANDKEIVLWGSGQAVRDFVYVKDAAACIPYFIENDFTYGNVPYLENVCNISTSKGCSIKELAETIVEVVGFKGNLVWDITKPEGSLNKTLANTRMSSIGLKCDTNLKEGIAKTYEWYLNSLSAL